MHTQCRFSDYLQFLIIYTTAMLYAEVTPMVKRVCSKSRVIRIPAPDHSTSLKVNVHPRTDHEGPQEGQRCSYTLSLASALDGNGWSTPRPVRFTPWKDPVPIVQEAGQAQRSVWTGAENLVPQRNSIPGTSSPQGVAIPTELDRPILMKCHIAFKKVKLFIILLQRM